jgi:hypothetical protein
MSRPIDLYGETIATSMFVSASVSGSTAVNGPDLNNNPALFEGGVIIVQVSGVTGVPTSFALTVAIQTAPDNGSGAAGTYVALKDGFGNVEQIIVTAAGVFKLRYEAATASKFVRVVVTPAFVGGTAPTATVAGVALLGSGKYGSQI